MALRFFGKACLRAVHRAQPRMACARNLSQESFEVEHDSEKREFFIKLGKDKAVLQYEVIDSKTLDLVHTEVPESLQGKGIAKHLAKARRAREKHGTRGNILHWLETLHLRAMAAFDYLVHEDLQARLSCTYLVKYWNETKSPEHTKHIMCA